ncbi:MAG: hypothetical protein ACM3TN_20800 [Alphaproteobacteria bacterium]
MARLSTLNKFLPLFTLALTLAALTLGTANISWADSLNEEMRDFNHFLNQHPRIAADLQSNPSLANNSGYLHNHDNLRDFLHNHPRVRRQLATNPGYALGAPYAWNSAPYAAYPPYTSAPYGVYPPYAGRHYGAYPPYASAPYRVYPPYAGRRYGSYRPHNQHPNGHQSNDRREKSERR